MKYTDRVYGKFKEARSSKAKSGLILYYKNGDFMANLKNRSKMLTRSGF
jgi:hypothetical protein